jgi:hypothetical protein
MNEQLRKQKKMKERQLKEEESHQWRWQWYRKSLLYKELQSKSWNRD